MTSDGYYNIGYNALGRMVGGLKSEVQHPPA
jgi:hypothetical protein